VAIDGMVNLLVAGTCGDPDGGSDPSSRRAGVACLKRDGAWTDFVKPVPAAI
jgi:hypothetical protein